MITTSSSSSEQSSDLQEKVVQEVQEEETVVAEGSGFVDQVAKSLLEPGTSTGVVIAMNVAFFLLILVLIGLGFLTQWNLNVILLLVSSVVLWVAMGFFVVEMGRVQTNPENMPGRDPLLDQATPAAANETRKDR